jgi:hypothetical protein
VPHLGHDQRLCLFRRSVLAQKLEPFITRGIANAQRTSKRALFGPSSSFAFADRHTFRSVRLTAMPLSCAARAARLRELRHDGCRAYRWTARRICNQHDAAILVFGPGASAPDRSRAVPASVACSAADQELALCFWQKHDATFLATSRVRTRRAAASLSPPLFSRTRSGGAARRRRCR